jgi:hypothetical protein
MAQALFVSREDIVKFTSLSGNVDVDNFIQWVKVAQDIHIQNYLGTDLFNKINNDIVAGTIANPYLALLTTYIKPMVIHWAMVEALPFMHYTIANKGIYKHGSENSETATIEEVEKLVDKYRSIAQNYTDRFIDYMCFNSTTFPEYLSNSDNDISPDKKINNYGGWYL